MFFKVHPQPVGFTTPAPGIPRHLDLQLSSKLRPPRFRCNGWHGTWVTPGGIQYHCWMGDGGWLYPLVNQWLWKIDYCNVRPPFDSVQLVNITTISLWFMVVITIVKDGVINYKPTYNVWGKCLLILMEDPMMIYPVFIQWFRKNILMAKRKSNPFVQDFNSKNRSMGSMG